MEGEQLPLLPELFKKRKRRTATPKRKVPGWIIWSRGISLFSVLAGGIGLMGQPDFFWFAVFLIYGGLVLLGLDVYFEPNLSRSFKGMSFAVIAAILVWFTAFKVFATAPLKVSSLVDGVDYVTGANIAGIKWHPQFTEVDLIFANPGDDNYDDINLLVEPNHAIAGIGQLGNLGDVSFDDFAGVTGRATIQDLITNVTNSMELIATDAGYRIHCGRIPAHSTLRIVLAIVDIKQAKPGVIQGHIDNSNLQLEYHLKSNSDGRNITYWYGDPSSEVFYQPAPKQVTVEISGSYVAKNRKFNMEAKTGN